jgi:hypothetical protein
VVVFRFEPSRLRKRKNGRRIASDRKTRGERADGMNGGQEIVGRVGRVRCWLACISGTGELDVAVDIYFRRCTAADVGVGAEGRLEA